MTIETTVENLSDVEVRIDVTVPAQDADREYAAQLAKVSRSARIKGFRPGKAPKAMVKRLYGSSVAAETTRELIDATIGDALGSLERDAIGQPSIEPGAVEEGKGLKYSIRVQVKPEIELVNWEGIEIAVPPAEVGEEAIESSLQEIRRKHKELVPVEDRTADIGDILKLKMRGWVDGEDEPSLGAAEMDVEIGKGDMIPGFEDELHGLKVGDVKRIETKFPDEYHAEEVAGKPVVFEVEVLTHVIEELPDLDDELAQDEGQDSLADLRNHLTAQLVEQANKERERQIEDKLIGVLLERNKFTVPPALMMAQLNANAERMALMMRIQGMDDAQAKQVIEQNIEHLATGAERVVKRFLALEALAAAQELTIDDDTLEAEIVKRIQQGGEAVAKHFETEDERLALRQEMLERASLDLLKRHANISDAPPESEGDEPTGDAVDQGVEPQEDAAADPEGGDEASE